MKITIDKDGLLELERAGKMKTQYCPYSEGEAQSPCGDWCPLFGERQKERARYFMRLCRINIWAGDFTDERVS